MLIVIIIMDCVLSFKQSITKNPDSAVEIALKNYDCECFGELLEALIDQAVHYQSMIVVGLLIPQIMLPEEFTFCFVLKCIVGMQTPEKYQLRKIRILCVFLINALDWRLIRDKRLIALINSFCYKHQSVPEAKALFEYIKSSYM